MDSQKVLQLAEKLYQKGWISYSRTDTDQFDQGMDLRSLVQKQAQGGGWAGYAMALVEGGFLWLRNGQNNDKAHPPIHPVNLVNPNTLSLEEQRVHDQPRQARHGNDEEGPEELPTQARVGNSRRGRTAVARRGAGRNSGVGRGHPVSGVREFIPTTLGVALVEGHENMGFETNLTKPFLRKEIS
jgi:hypothetical protein